MDYNAVDVRTIFCVLYGMSVAERAFHNVFFDLLRHVDSRKTEL